jgi:hypothetical protein
MYSKLHTLFLVSVKCTYVFQTFVIYVLFSKKDISFRKYTKQDAELFCQLDVSVLALGMLTHFDLRSSRFCSLFRYEPHVSLNDITKQ